MNYMASVPYYQTLPTLSEQAFGLPNVPVASSSVLAEHLLGFDETFDLKFLEEARLPVAVSEWKWPIHAHLKGEVYVLRLPIKRPGECFAIPLELYDLRGLLILCDTVQRANDPHYEQKYCYLTVRCGERATTDTTWHVDGFQAGVRQQLKRPEVNYVWADQAPTEFFEGRLCMHEVDPTRDNVHSHLDRQIQAHQEGNVVRGQAEGVYAMNPYMPHRKPPHQGFRRFVRVTFCETEIRDDTCASNPCLPMPTYDNRDVRWQLKEAPGS